MTLLYNYVTQFRIPLLVSYILFLSINSVCAQKEYTTISKNINSEAQSLYHDLSPKGDSLYLGAESIFYKVTFLNSLDRKVYTFNPPVLKAKIPLHDIIVGDYTVMVYKKDRIIVFHISRLLEIAKPSEILKSNDVIIGSDITKINLPVIKKVKTRERAISKVASNEIKYEFDFKLSMAELKNSVSDTNINGEVLADNSPLPYNITSMNRKNMQSREDYRRENLRPNGKSY